MSKSIFNKINKRTCHFIFVIELIVASAILHCFKRYLLDMKIWLICEKRDEARDNGYHFYKYIKEKHPEINAYYVITSDSVDIEKVNSIGPVIQSDSWKHALYYLAAENSISSQAYGAFPFGLNLNMLKKVRCLCNRRQKTVFLQHGVIKDELAHSAFDYDVCNIDYFVCSALREYDFVKTKYHYPDNSIECVGLARFDHLLSPHPEERIILIMPTWRMWLNRANIHAAMTREEKNTFTESQYFKAYGSLLTDPGFQTELRRYGYKCIFYMHYQMQSFSELFESLQNDVIIIADQKHFDVQDLLMRSKLLITDFSSVFFDFSYMNKPVIYYQFDKERFEKAHYEKGYFDYEQDGFGPVFMRAKDVADYTAKLLASDCSQELVYRERVNGFFTPKDGNNCLRTYEAVIRLHAGETAI